MPKPPSKLTRYGFTAPDGACFEVYRHGGHVTSWIPTDGEERLFLSRNANFSDDNAIRGGAPVIFPQFGREGSLPPHGFARNMSWELAKTEQTPAGVTAVFQVQDSEASRRIWPHRFLAELAITAGRRQLALALTITNSGDEAFTFTGALHTYLRVADINATLITGLGGQPYLDTVGPPTQRMQTERDLAFTGEVDRIYFNAPSRLAVLEKTSQMSVTTDGFPDVVIWNPWIERSAQFADLEPEGYRRFVCVEAAVIGRPVALLPGERWSGTQRLVA
jgi:glucose-6-phosphate 1-epimerase